MNKICLTITLMISVLFSLVVFATKPKLIGIVRFENASKSLARIQFADRSFLMNQGAELNQDFRLLKIESDHVVYEDRQGDRIQLYFEEALSPPVRLTETPSRKPKSRVKRHSENRIYLSKEELFKQINDYEVVQKQIDVRASNQEGQFLGWKVMRIDSGTVWSKLGLKERDLLVGAFGKPVLNRKDAMAFLREVVDKERILLNIVREGEKKEILYDLY